MAKEAQVARKNAKAGTPHGRMGVPAYNEVRHAQIVTAIRKTGVSRRGAALATGISDATLSLWLRMAKDDRNRGVPKEESDHPEYHQLLEDIEQAEGEVEVKLTGSLLGLAQAELPQSGTAIISMLERRFRQDWGRHDHVTVDGGVAAIQLDGRQLNDPALTAAAQALLDRVAGTGEDEPSGSGPRNVDFELPPGDIEDVEEA